MPQTDMEELLEDTPSRPFQVGGLAAPLQGVQSPASLQL